MICTINHIILQNIIKSQEHNVKIFDKIYSSDSDQSENIKNDDHPRLNNNSPQRSKRIYSYETTDEIIEDRYDNYLIYITKPMNQINTNNNRLHQAIKKLDESKNYALTKIIKNTRHMKYNILVHQKHNFYNNKHIHLFFIKYICFQLSQIEMSIKKQDIIGLIKQLIKREIWKSNNKDIISKTQKFDDYLLYKYPELLSKIIEKSNDIEGINELLNEYEQKRGITEEQYQLMYLVQLYYRKMRSNIDITKYINNISDINEHKIIYYMKINKLFDTISILQKHEYSYIYYLFNLFDDLLHDLQEDQKFLIAFIQKYNINDTEEYFHLYQGQRFHGTLINEKCLYKNDIKMFLDSVLYNIRHIIMFAGSIYSSYIM